MVETGESAGWKDQPTRYIYSNQATSEDGSHPPGKVPFKFYTQY